MGPDSVDSLAVPIAYSLPLGLGLVWLIAGMARLAYARLSWRLALTLGLAAYVLVGAGVWVADPNDAVEDTPGGEFRFVMSASWSAGPPP